MACYKVWWLGGYLGKDDDRPRYHEFGTTIAQVFYTLATVNDHFRQHYQFAWHERCTKKDFRERWRDPLTAGIILHGHGDFTVTEFPPLAYHHSIDIESTPPWKDRSEIRLHPRELQSSSPSLRILALLSCLSGRLNREWSEVTPKNTSIVTVDGLLTGDSEYGRDAKAGINKWIWNDCLNSIDFRHAVKDVGEKTRSRYEKWAKDERAVLRDPMQSTLDKARTSTWELFKWLVNNGPAGAPLNKTRSGLGSSTEGSECKTVSQRLIGGTRVPGPAGAGIAGTQTQSKRGPIGMA